MTEQSKYTALIVDDDLLSLSEMFEYMNLVFKTVYKAQNIQEALACIKIHNPSIIFTDLEMPNTDGFSLISKVRETNSVTPIVIISAYDDKEKLLKAIQLDIVDYLIKPLNSKKLSDVIKLSMKKLQSLDMKVNLGNGFILNKERFNLYKDHSRIPLTKSEAKLLKILFSNINCPIHSVDIFNYVWNSFDKEYSAKSIRTLISKLRKKFENQDIIQNIYGGQYMLVVKNEGFA